jgi:methyl-accepting chemotaxis protein
MEESASTGQDDPGSNESPGLRSTVNDVVPAVITDNLLAKFVVGILLIVVLTGGIAVFFHSGIADQLDTQVTTQVEETNGLHADIYTAWHENRFEDLESITAEESLDIKSEQVRSDLLTRGRDNLGHFEQLHLVDTTSGEVLASSSEDAVGENMFDRINESLVEESEFTTPYQYTSVTGETVVGFGRTRLLNSTHVVIGEVPADGGPEFRQTIAGSDTILTDQDGTVVFGNESLDPAVVGTGGANATTVTQSGGWIHASNRISGTDLFVVTNSPSNEAFALRDSVLQSFVVMLVLAFGVLGAVGFVGGRSIVSSITTLNDRAEEMEDGNLSVDLKTNRTDEIGELYDGFASMRDSLRDRITEAEEALEQATSARERAESAREEAASAREEAEAINEQIESSADRYSDVMRAAANGDLTVRMTPDEENEAMAAIAEDFNAMLEEFQATVQEITTFADEVAAASEEVTTSSQEMRVASEQVSEAIQEISTDAMEQNDSLQTVTNEMNDLSATVEEIAASSDEVASVAQRTAETGRDGREAAQTAIEGMETIRTESQRAVDEIEVLAEQVQQVDDLIARISDIAEQTSILALNANIEAARASGETGSGGDGFAVVANEVKVLSEDAKAAAEEVEDRLEGIREQTQEAAEVVQAASDDVDEHTQSVENAATALSEVANYAAETNEGIQEISASTDQQATSTETVVRMVDEVASIADRTTKNAENTAATAEEQAASMSEVSESATDLAEQATQLSETLDRFRTD